MTTSTIIIIAILVILFIARKSIKRLGNTAEKGLQDVCIGLNLAAEQYAAEAIKEHGTRMLEIHQELAKLGDTQAARKAIFEGYKTID